APRQVPARPRPRPCAAARLRVLPPDRRRLRAGGARRAGGLLLLRLAARRPLPLPRLARLRLVAAHDDARREGAPRRESAEALPARAAAREPEGDARRGALVRAAAARVGRRRLRVVGPQDLAVRDAEEPVAGGVGRRRARLDRTPLLRGGRGARGRG